MEDTPPDLVAPMVAPAHVFSCHTLTSFGMDSQDAGTDNQIQNPLQGKGFGTACHFVTADDASEAEGTRTPNPRIDSPVL